jgi:hypothetical protein
MINAYINHTGEKESILLPILASNLVKLLHVGTHDPVSNRYLGF